MKNMKKGFTLIELVIYLGLLTIFLGLIGTTVNAMFTTSDDMIARNEVLANQQLVERKLTWLMQEASSVIQPGLDSSSTTLGVTEYKASISPATFSLAAGQIMLSLGGNEPTPLTNNRVRVTQFLNEHFSSSEAPSSLRITFTMQGVTKTNVSSTAIHWFTIPY